MYANYHLSLNMWHCPKLSVFLRLDPERAYLCKQPRCEVTLNLYPYCSMALPSLVWGKSLCYPWASIILPFANFEITLSNC